MSAAIDAAIEDGDSVGGVISCEITGVPAGEIAGRILQGKMDAYNDFGSAPLKAESFTDFEIRNDEIIVQMPACAVAEIRL